MDIRIVLAMIVSGMTIASCAGNSARHRPVFPMPQVKKDCSTCHRATEGRMTSALRKPLADLCLDCHRDRIAPAEHRIGIAPQANVKDLPLNEGKISCVTCHDPHKNPYGSLLRKPQTDLCLTCHPL